MHRISFLSVGLIATICVASNAFASTVFEFRLPTGDPYPFASYDSATLTVPNDILFDEIDAFQDDLYDALEQAAADDGDLVLLDLALTFSQPEIILAGEGTSVILTVGGIDQVEASVVYRLTGQWWSWIAVPLCGVYAWGTARVDDLAIDIEYDYYSGGIVRSEARYRDVHANITCPGTILGYFLVEAAEYFDIVDDFASGFVDDYVSDLAGDYQNLFSLQDALQGLQATSNSEIQAAADRTLQYLSGVRIAAASFIANEITEELIQRLGLDTQQEIDALQDQLSELVDYISTNLPQLDTMSLSDLANADFDIADYLATNLPDLQSYLLVELQGYYDNAVAAVNDIAAAAFEALEDLVDTDWGRIFGGLNLRLRIDRLAHEVILDAYHDAPPSFRGLHDVVGPCTPEYIVGGVENASSYRLYNITGGLFYEGSQLTHAETPGLLNMVNVKGRQGLYSYPTLVEIVLWGWQDYHDPLTWVWPQCATAGPPGPPLPPPDDPIPDPPGPPNPPEPPDPPGPPWHLQ